MSIPAEPSLLQNEVQILNAKPHKKLIRSDGDSVLQLDIADLSDHCPVISLHTLEVWLCQWLSLTGMEHCTPHTELYTWPCVLKKRSREERSGSSSLNFFQAVLWLKVHSHRLLRACLLDSKRKLSPPACQVKLGLPSVVCHPRGMMFPFHMYVGKHVFTLVQLG